MSMDGWIIEIIFKYENSKSVIEICQLIQQFADNLSAQGEEVEECNIYIYINMQEAEF